MSFKLPLENKRFKSPGIDSVHGQMAQAGRATLLSGSALESELFYLFVKSYKRLTGNFREFSLLLS
jgi:hypothetical protein